LRSHFSPPARSDTSLLDIYTQPIILDAISHGDANTLYESSDAATWCRHTYHARSIGWRHFLGIYAFRLRFPR